MKSIIKYIGMLIIPFCLTMVSCEDDKSYPDTTADETVIYSIKILNAGIGGNEVVIGTVDENRKEITFPEVHMETDLSKVKFEIEGSDRAHLDSVEYSFIVPEGASQRKRTIAVVNGLRKREYFATIRLDVPVWGADFTKNKVKVYDYSGATPTIAEYAGGVDQPMYLGAAADHGRQYGLSLQNVLVASRPAAGIPELLKISDLKQGTISSTPLVGYNSGWFGINGGTMVNGHIYLCNGATTSISFDVWEEAHPELPPTRITNASVATSGTTASAADGFPGYAGRYEGFVSADIDADGNGYLYTHSNNGHTSNMIRATISGFKTLTSVSVVQGADPHPGSWASINRVPGKAEEYIYSGYNSNYNATYKSIRLADASGSVLYEVPAGLIGMGNGVDAKVVTFNNERYLIMMSSGAGTFSVYDITLGATTRQALELLDTSSPLFTYSLGGAIPNANASISTAWVADGDETLYLLAGGVQAGFVLFEVPKKVKENQ